jgi:hypothetical protein
MHACPQRLRELDINIIEEEAADKDYSMIDNGDVVIFPAFGATVQEMQLFRDKEVQMVDTTCPWVAKVGSGSRSSSNCGSRAEAELQHRAAVALLCAGLGMCGRQRCVAQVLDVHGLQVASQCSAARQRAALRTTSKLAAC